jgi:DDE superfamily endonuclease
VAIIDKILVDDKCRPKTPQDTSKRIFQRLRDEHGYTGGITIVKDYAVGEALAVIGGVEQKIYDFAFDLPHSHANFVIAYPAETMEAFCDGHVQALALFGGVPQSASATTPRSRWPRSLATASACGHAWSPSCNCTTCSRIGSDAQPKATTKARSKGASAGVLRLIHEAGTRFLCLPRHSPDLNPIEQVFANLKTSLRNAEERAFETVWRPIGPLLDCFKPAECANHLRNGGYSSN